MRLRLRPLDHGRGHVPLPAAEGRQLPPVAVQEVRRELERPLVRRLRLLGGTGRGHPGDHLGGHLPGRPGHHRGSHRGGRRGEMRGNLLLPRRLNLDSLPTVRRQAGDCLRHLAASHRREKVVETARLLLVADSLRAATAEKEEAVPCVLGGS